MSEKHQIGEMREGSLTDSGFHPLSLDFCHRSFRRTAARPASRLPQPVAMPETTATFPVYPDQRTCSKSSKATFSAFPPSLLGFRPSPEPLILPAPSWSQSQVAGGKTKAGGQGIATCQEPAPSHTSA